MSTLIASEWSDAVEFTVRPLGEGYSEVAKIVPIEGLSDSEFGRGLAVDADAEFMLAPMARYNVPYTSAGCVDVYQRVNSVWKRVAKIVSPSPALNEAFGRDAALSRDGLTAYITAEGNSVKGSYTGCLYIFTRVDKTSNNWVHQTTIYPEDPQINGYFGTSVAISSDQKTLAVGMVWDPRYMYTGIAAGAIYIFKKGTDGVWYQNQKLISSDLNGASLLGRKVAFSGNGKELVANAPRVPNEVDSPYSNTFYHFTLVGPVYIQTSVTQLPDSVIGVENGGSVSLSEDGTVMAISNTFDKARGAAESGAVYIFEKTAGYTWTPKQKIIPSTPGALFGTDVVLSADASILMVGARFDDTASTNSGAIYFYDRISEDFQYQLSVTPKAPSAEDAFGRAIALNKTGDLMLIGAHGDSDDTDPATYPGLGSVYCYVRNGAVWTQVQKIVPSQKISLGAFGRSVAMSQDGLTAIIGYPGDNNGGPWGVGAFYYYKNINGSWVETAKVYAPDGAAYDNFGTSVALDAQATYAAIGNVASSGGVAGSGNLYIYTRSGDVWTYQQKITSPEPEESGVFGYAVSLNSDATTFTSNPPPLSKSFKPKSSPSAPSFTETTPVQGITSAYRLR
jgi:hypothetical protein